jgi:hypothetical protein
LSLGCDPCLHLGIDGPRTGDDPTCIYDGLKYRFPTCGRLAGKDDDTDAIRTQDSAALGESLGKFLLIELDVFLGVTQFMGPIYDDLVVLGR